MGATQNIRSRKTVATISGTASLIGKKHTHKNVISGNGSSGRVICEIDLWLSETETHMFFDCIKATRNTEIFFGKSILWNAIHPMRP